MEWVGLKLMYVSMCMCAFEKVDGQPSEDSNITAIYETWYTDSVNWRLIAILIVVLLMMCLFVCVSVVCHYRREQKIIEQTFNTNQASRHAPRARSLGLGRRVEIYRK